MNHPDRQGLVRDLLEAAVLKDS